MLLPSHSACRFLSTPSARRATLEPGAMFNPFRISIHALCEEGDPFCLVMDLQYHISIHALCEEGDCSAAVEMFFSMIFLSTPSARRATLSDCFVAAL